MVGTFADRARGTRHQRGYGTAWDKLRRLVLKRDAGLCQPCSRDGVVTSANIVDHIVPRAQGGDDDPGNLQVICRSCHTRKTAGEAKVGRQGGGVVKV